MHEHITCVRRFNRFYSRHVGSIGRRFIGTEFSAPEGQLLLHLLERGVSTAGQLSQSLPVSSSYLSRLLHLFARRGLIERRKSDSDLRQVLIGLTERGRAATDLLERAQEERAAAMLHALSQEEREKLCASMETIERILSANGTDAVALWSTLEPGDAD